MAHRLIKKYIEMLDGHSTTVLEGSFSPLFVVNSWLKGLRIPLLEINKGRRSLCILDEYYYRLCSEEKFRQYIEKKISRRELEKEFYAYVSQTQSVHDEAVQIDLSKADEKTILSFVEKARNLYEICASTIYIETFDYNMALEVVGREHKATLDIVWEQATHPTFISFEGRQLAYLVKLIKETSNLSVLVRKVKWMYTDYYWTKNDAEILASLEEIRNTLPEREKELESIYKNVAERKSAYVAWEKSLAKGERFLAEYIQMVMLFRDVRKDPIAQMQVVLIETIVELLKRADIDPKYAFALNIHECVRGVEYLKSIKNELIKRSNGNIALMYSDTTVDIEPCEYEKAVEEFYAATPKNSETPVDSVQGQVANKGNVTGTVRIVLDPNDDKGFVNGDVLVTSMTRPEFVPLMKRAGAVVTNEGGITCHAAIVSRELGIPCIIGTKNATRVLHDGDLVEVDAEKGIVRVLERK